MGETWVTFITRLFGEGLGIGIVEIWRSEIEGTKEGMWRACWVEGSRVDIVSAVICCYGGTDVSRRRREVCETTSLVGVWWVLES